MKWNLATEGVCCLLSVLFRSTKPYDLLSTGCYAQEAVILVHRQSESSVVVRSWKVGVQKRVHVSGEVLRCPRRTWFPEWVASVGIGEFLIRFQMKTYVTS